MFYFLRDLGYLAKAEYRIKNAVKDSCQPVDIIANAGIVYVIPRPRG
jgi:hypothetical protein